MNIDQRAEIAKMIREEFRYHNHTLHGENEKPGWSLNLNNHSETIAELIKQFTAIHGTPPSVIVVSNLYSGYGATMLAIHGVRIVHSKEIDNPMVFKAY